MAGIDNNYLKNWKSPGTFKGTYKGFCQTQRERKLHSWRCSWASPDRLPQGEQSSCDGEPQACLSESPSSAFPQAFEDSWQRDLLGTAIYVLFRESLECGASVERREAVNWAGRIEYRPLRQTWVTWAEERQRRKWMLPSPKLSIPLNQGCLHKCVTVQWHRAPSSKRRVLGLRPVLCCRHLAILNNFLTWVLTFSFCTEPHKSCSQSCSPNRAAMMSGPYDNIQSWGLPTPNLPAGTKKWRKWRLIIFLTKWEILWDGIFFLFGNSLTKRFIFCSLPALYLFKKSFGLTWCSLRDRIVITRPTRRKMPHQLNPVQYALISLGGKSLLGPVAIVWEEA